MGKFFFVIFLQENFRVQFLPEGSAPQWEGGVVSALYVLQARVLITCTFFSGDAPEFFSLMYSRVCTLVHVFVALYLRKFVCPDPLIFSTLIHFFPSCSVFRYTQMRLIQNSGTKLFFNAQ